MSEPLNTDILLTGQSTQSVDNIISNPLLDLQDITTDITDYNPAKSKSLIQDIALESIEKQKKAVEKIKLTRTQSDLLRPLVSENPYDFLPMSDEEKNKISLSGAEVDPDLLYKELNSGDLIPKYDTFVAGVNNEDYAYGTQTTTDRWVNGFEKLVGKTAVNIVSGTIGTVYGIKEAIATGTFNAIYNNDFTNFLDDLNTRMDYGLPNYKSTYEKNMGFLRSMTTANFWADDVFSGISFTLGAIGTELVWAGLTGGASLVGGVGRFTLKLGAKSTLKGLGKQAEKSFLKNSGKLFKQYLKTVPNSNRARIINNARFLYTSAGFEAGVESRQAFNESFDNFVRSYEKVYNRKPNGAEMANFLDSAVDASNIVFATNVAIVGGSNILQFGTYFGVGGGLTKAIDKSIGRMFGAGLKKEMLDGGKELSMKALKQTTRQKVLSNIWSFLESPFVEGVYEEGLQGVTSTAAKNWLDAKYNPDALKQNYDWVEAVRDGFAHTYGTKEGFKEIGIGMIIGLFGSAGKKSEATGKWTPFNIGQYTELSKSYEKVAKEYNKFSGHITEAHKKLLDRLVNTNQFVHFINKSKQEAEKGNKYQATTDFDIAQFTKMMIDDKADMLDESIDDFRFMLENMDDEAIKEQYKLSDDEIGAYKAALLDTYKENVDLYKKSKRIAESLSPGSKYTPRKDYKHELALNIYLGYKAGGRAAEIADEINKIIGTGGIGSALRLYTNLNKRSKRAGKRLVALEQEIEDLEKEYAQFQTSFTSYKTDKKERVKENKEVGRKLDKTYEKAQKTLEKIQKKRSELEELQKKLEGRFYYRDFKFGSEIFDEGKGLYVTEQQLKDSIKELEKLDKYIKTLRQENQKVADALDSLLNEYQMNVIAFRDYNKIYEEMSDVRFMQKESKGIAKLFSDIGEKLDNITQKDDPVFGESSRKVEEIIEKNPDMSEEDKFTLRTLNKLVTAFQLQKRLPSLDKDVQDKIDTIDKEAFDKIMDSGELPQSLNDNISNKIINGEKLTPREQEIYNKFKDEIDKNVEEIKFNKGDSLNKVRRKLIKPDKSIDNLTKRLENLIDQIKNRNHYLTNLDYQDYSKEDIPTEKEYKEFERLTKKKMKGKLTPRQRTRYNNLKTKINNWGKLEGAISGRATLSDIIEQLIYLKENSGMKDDVLGSLISLDDIIDIEDLRPTSNNSNYDHLQTYDKAFVQKSNSGEEYNISNISLKGLLNIIAGAGHTVKIERKGKVKELDKLKTKAGETYIVTIDNKEKILFKINQRGNLVVTKAGKEKLNQSTNIKIMPNTLSLSKYSSLLQEVKVGDEVRLETVPTDFEFTQDMNIESVWGLKPNDTLYLEVDTSDPYNKQLLRKYKNAKESLEKIGKDDSQKENSVLSPLNEKVKKQITDIIDILNNESDLIKALDRLKSKGLVYVNNNSTITNDAGRDIIIFKVNNTPLLFYKSYQGTQGKEQGKWYPFITLTEDWIVKSISNNYKDGYNNYAITSILNTLNSKFKLVDKKYTDVKTDIQELRELQGLDNEYKDIEVGSILNPYVYRDAIKVFESIEQNVGGIHLSNPEEYIDGVIRKWEKSNKDNSNNDVIEYFATLKDIFKDFKKQFSTQGSVKLNKLRQDEIKALEELNAGLVIYVKDKNNNLVGVHKASFNNVSTKDNENLTKLKEVRNFAVKKVLDENFMENQVIDLGMSVKVDKVYVGHPKISLKKDENGKVFVEYNRITDKDTKHIVDIGYSENGKVKLKNKEQGVEMFPFMTKLQRDSKYKGKKIPFVVVEFKGRKIAYPVNLVSSKLDLSEEFLNVYNNNALEQQEKILKLNDIIKYGGLDINTFGITFDNLNSKNISLVAKELSNIDQLPDITKWINGNMSMEDILKEQVEINLNLSGDMFHSPKIVTKLKDIPIPKSTNAALFGDDVDIDNETETEINQLKNEKC